MKKMYSTANHTHMKTIIEKQPQHCVNKFANLNKMGKFLENQNLLELTIEKSQCYYPH